mmetsp:Transcript_71583/g.185854  ORF Transcript_71583/g.185854 Transcript_71583/m.185854 type:complete len:196 (+) Transcript_71583:1100-1687(+)
MRGASSQVAAVAAGSTTPTAAIDEPAALPSPPKPPPDPPSGQRPPLLTKAAGEGDGEGREGVADAEGAADVPRAAVAASHAATREPPAVAVMGGIDAPPGPLLLPPPPSPIPLPRGLWAAYSEGDAGADRTGAGERTAVRGLVFGGEAPKRPPSSSHGGVGGEAERSRAAMLLRRARREEARRLFRAAPLVIRLS